MLPVQILTWVIKWKELWAKGCFSVWRWYSGLTPLQVGIHMNPLWLRPGSHQNLLTCVLWQFPSQLFFFFSTDRKIKTDTMQWDTGHCLPQNKFSLPFKYTNKTSVRKVPMQHRRVLCYSSGHEGYDLYCFFKKCIMQQTNATEA